LSGAGNKSTILALVNALAEAFPEFNRRVVAVSEAEVTADNVPNDPIIFVSLINAPVEADERTGRKMTITENILVEFWKKTEKITSQKTGRDTPFWAFYDYDDILERFFTMLEDFRSPRGNRVVPVQMDMEASNAALMLPFTLRHRFDFCAREKEDEGTAFTISWGACPKSHNPDPCCEEEGNGQDQCQS
jgi:hypothetical protein